MIFFDTTFLQYGSDLRGISQVIHQLLRFFSSDIRFTNVQFIATKKTKILLSIEYAIPENKIHVVPLVPLLSRYERYHGLFSNFRYRKIKKQASLIIHPEFRTIVSLKIPQVVILYDFIFLAPKSLAGKRKWDRYLYFYCKIRKAIKARYLIAISNFTKQTASQYFPSINPDSITVLHLGTRLQIFKSPKVLYPQSKIRFLYVGSFEPRKNVFKMLENWDDISQHCDSELHIAGNIYQKQTVVLDKILSTCNLSKKVIIHGKVSNQQLSDLYSISHFLVFPSLIEGFGLPVIEAMSQGLVVCSFDNSTMREIGGDALICSSTNDFITWGKKIREITESPNIYTELSAKSIDQCSNFTENKMMERYTDYFNSLFMSI
jgi:glycosyltransferase involved in cell wall biosynthesis